MMGSLTAGILANFRSRKVRRTMSFAREGSWLKEVQHGSPLSDRLTRWMSAGFESMVPICFRATTMRDPGDSCRGFEGTPTIQRVRNSLVLAEKPLGTSPATGAFFEAGGPDTESSRFASESWMKYRKAIFYS